MEAIISNYPWAINQSDQMSTSPAFYHPYRLISTSSLSTHPSIISIKPSKHHLYKQDRRRVIYLMLSRRMPTMTAMLPM